MKKIVLIACIKSKLQLDKLLFTKSIMLKRKLDDIEIISAFEYREEIDKKNGEFFFGIRYMFFQKYKEAKKNLDAKFLLCQNVKDDETLTFPKKDGKDGLNEYNKLELYLEIAEKMFLSKGYIVKKTEDTPLDENGESFKKDFGFDLNKLVNLKIEPTYKIVVKVPDIADLDF